MKNILFILLFVLSSNHSMAVVVEKERAGVKKERRALRKEQQQQRKTEMKKKFDTRSPEQKRKDRTILFLMALAGFLIFDQMHE